MKAFYSKSPIKSEPSKVPDPKVDGLSLDSIRRINASHQERVAHKAKLSEEHRLKEEQRQLADTKAKESRRLLEKKMKATASIDDTKKRIAARKRLRKKMR